MKKTAILFSAVFCLLLVLASCTIGLDHQHSFSYSKVDREPSCTSRGLEFDYCECGVILNSREIPETAHDFIETVDHGKAPTCVTVGYTPVLYCKYCDAPDYDARTEIPMIDHVFEYPCQSYCRGCGFSYPDIAKDHVYDNEYDDCCNVCGEYRDVEECHHTNIDVKQDAVLPSCEEDGYTASGICLDCQQDISSEIIEKLGHEWDDGEITDAPTCLKTGIKTFTCTRGCERTEVVDIVGHDYDDKDFCTVCSIHASTLELKYASNGDGTCTVSKGRCTRDRIVIPETSPSGDTVIAIADNAFDDLTYALIDIPATVSTISTSAFGLTKCSFNVAADNPSYKAIDGSLYSFDEKTLLKYKYTSNENSIVVPDSVTTISSYALSRQAVESITIPESVTYIGDMAFADTAAIRNVYFYVKEATYIADTAFYKVSGIRNVHIKSIEDSLLAKKEQLKASIETNA